MLAQIYQLSFFVFYTAIVPPKIDILSGMCVGVVYILEMNKDSLL